MAFTFGFAFVTRSELGVFGLLGDFGKLQELESDESAHVCRVTSKAFLGEKNDGFSEVFSKRKPTAMFKIHS